MKNLFIAIICFLGLTSVNAQDNSSPFPQVIDSLYREDQFYLGITYNLLNNKPNEVKQNGFSSGFNFGFILGVFNLSIFVMGSIFSSSIFSK